MPLQKSFRGLPDHIGRFEGGNLKLDIDQFVKLGLSGEDFITPVEDLFTSGTLTAVDQIATHAAIPSGEFWRVRYAAVRSVDTGGATTWAAVWSDDGSRFFGLDFQMSNGAVIATPANRVASIGRLFDGQEGFILRPPQRLGFRLYNSTAAPPSVDFTTIIRRQVIKF